MKVATGAAAPWHSINAVDAAARLGVDPASGLSSAEAERRLAETGPNELPSAAPPSPGSMLLSQFKNVLVVILLVAIGLSMALGEHIEALAIAVITLFTVVLGFIQEFRAERALEALRRLTAPTATVLRDGEERAIPARELVPGDIVSLVAGDLVPADARLLDAVNLQANEAHLTGESAAVEKQRDAALAEETSLADRLTMIFSGTAITVGRGRAIVTATGDATEVGRIGTLLRAVTAQRTPLERHLDRIGAWLARAALVVVLGVVVLGLFRGQPLLEMVVFGIALAVAVVPEALPAVVTISLAIGAQRMAKRHALIRRLPTVETLGSTTVICSDKTGTLTAGEMTVRELVVGGRRLTFSGAGYEPVGTLSDSADAGVLALLRAGVLCSDAHLIRIDRRWRVQGDPTEGALVVAAAKLGLSRARLDSEQPRVGELAFTAERKRMTTLHAGGIAFSKGAPEVILESCGRADLLPEAQRMAAQAMRVLAIATKSGATLEEAECGMTLLGLVGLIDPPRPEAREAISRCHDAGIRPVMITGDHPLTARAIAAELGFAADHAVTGAELDALTDDELDRRTIDVFARVSPAHKLRVVESLQRRGEIVAMTGDGVNDAPALKRADVGIAMGISGTPVAKEAAAMTLTDDNFASIVAAVAEGRAIFDNIKKYLMYLLSSNIGEIALMAAAMAAGLPLPLTAVQILYVNLATDGLPALALAFDPASTDLMKRRPHKPGAGIFAPAVIALITIGGLWSMIVNLALFAWTRGSGRPVGEAMTMVFVSLVLIQFCKAYCFRSERESIVRAPFANRWLNRAILWELALLVLVVYVPALHHPFGTHPLSLVDWAIVAAAAASVIPVLELAKAFVRRSACR